MDLNNYVLEALVRERLAEMRAKGEQSARLQAVMPQSRPLRSALGHALIRLGELLHGPGASRTTNESRRSTHEAVRG